MPLKNKGFTLIELLVVIGIIGTLATISIVQVNNTIHKAKIAAGLQFSQSLYNSLGTELVASWDFNNLYLCGGYQCTNDSSINGNTCHTINGSSIDQVDSLPLLGKALDFGGNWQDYIQCDHNLSFDFTDGITIEAWVKASAVDNNERYLLRRPAPGNILDSVFLFDLMRSWKKVPGMAVFLDGEFHFTNYKKPLIVDKWTHLAATYSSLTHKTTLYRDGGKDNEVEWKNHSDYTLPLSEYKLTIGDRFYGSIDNVRIYRQAISMAQIQKHYIAGINSHKN